jgi:myo-inositol-1(or 4)-monophosphatase
MPEIENVEQVACQAARRAGDLILQATGEIGVSAKGEGLSNLVTEVDIEAQRVIIETIRQHFPEHAVLGEEDGQVGAIDAEHLWVIDPLDGTNNFVHGVPQYAVSVAYAERGVVQAGAVLDPNRAELFAAIRGRGATLNGRPIHVSDRPSLGQLMVATGFYYERGVLMQRTLDAIARLFSHDIHGIRRFGAAALDLCWVACGRFDAFFEYHLSPWDYAAATLAIEEAGGRCEDRRGAPLRLGADSVVTANPAVFDAFAAVVRCHDED